MSKIIRGHIVSCQIEFKLEDFWIGAFWKSFWNRGKRKKTDIWICIVPCFPLHIMIWHPFRKDNNHGN